VIWQTLKIEGIQGIFRGSLMSYIGMIIFRGIYFGVYDSYKLDAKS
jgi:solute carrier family 25 (adenine nucleotide translocator) protein 4/5/6/31